MSALTLSAATGINFSTCAAVASLSAVAGELQLHVPQEAGSPDSGGLREWMRTLSAFISGRAFSFADAVAWNRRGVCQSGREGAGLSFTTAPGATDGRLTVARLINDVAFQVMLDVPICHGVVRWEVLLHRGSNLAIGCTAWPVIGPGPTCDNPRALRNSWVWCPHNSDALFRGAPGPAGARWPTVLADGASE